MREIIGNTTATPNPRSDWAQTDETKADYIKNKPDIVGLNANVRIQQAITSGQIVKVALNWTSYYGGTLFVPVKFQNLTGVFAIDWGDGNLIYYNEDVTEYTYEYPKDNIPNTYYITIYGCTKIGEGAFGNQHEAGGGPWSVEVGHGVKEIVYGAFNTSGIATNSNVHYLKINAEKVGRVFANIPFLTEVEFGENVKEIGSIYDTPYKRYTVIMKSLYPPTLKYNGLPPTASPVDYLTIIIPPYSLDKYKKAKVWSEYTEVFKSCILSGQSDVLMTEDQVREIVAEEIGDINTILENSNARLKRILGV